jgi:hypothetical protein
MGESINCSICHLPIAEKYCSKCGQKAAEKRTTTASMIVDFITNIFYVERSGFATILKIIVSPKSIVDNYHKGYRNYYASPGKVLLYGIAIIALHLNLVDRKIMGLSMDIDNVSSQYLFWAMLFPFLLLISYFTFIPQEKSFSKHLISITYIAISLFILVTVLNDILILTAGDLLGIWAFTIFVSLTFLWNSRVFTVREKAVYIWLNAIIQTVLFVGIIGVIVWSIEN